MDYTKIFLDGMAGCREFEEALSIIRNNSFGHVWLIGGSVFRTIASELYGTKKPSVDFDFIIEKPVSTRDIRLPDKWIVGASRFGNPKLIGPSQSIDFVPLENVYSIRHRDMTPCIDAYLSGVPLNIQSIAYDVISNAVIGDVGMRALENKVVEVNDIHYAKHGAFMKETLLRDYISRFARELDFTPIYPDGRD